jgi:hypothetical protein
LIAEDDHHGRVGAEEFLRAANLLHATAPERVDFNPATSDSASLADELKSERPDAIVLWVSREAAATLLPALHQAVPSDVTYLSEQGCTSFRAILADLVQCLRRFINHRARAEVNRALPRADWPRPDRSGKGNLRCCAPSGRGGSHCGAGLNRARVRDYLASGTTFLGVSAAVSFDKAGNSKSEFVLQGAADPAVQAAF